MSKLNLTDAQDEGKVDGKIEKKKEEKKTKIVSLIIKKSMLIIFVSMIFLTISYLIYLGMFIFLKTQTTTVQNVTVSSEGPMRRVIKNHIHNFEFRSKQRGLSSINEFNFFIACQSEMYSGLLGDYRLTDIEQNGRPVYKHLEAEKFILYSSGN